MFVFKPPFPGYQLTRYASSDLLAINLARTSGLDEGEIAEIYRKYGDHLYNKGDYDGAMAAYIKTIGQVQPSYIIRKVRLSL